MEIHKINPPRTFRVGADSAIEISHCANIELQSDEQITFVTQSGTEYDVAKKSWGYYATPSTNSRLSSHKLRAALVVNQSTQLYIMLCESGQEASFQEYLDVEEQRLLLWLDSDANVQKLINSLTFSDGK